MILRITREQSRLLIEETRKRCPEEACGLLFGDVSGKEAVVKKTVTVRNVLESPTNFQIDPEEFLRELSEAEKEGMQFIGFFHSHPTTPQPSVTDLRYMQLWPGEIWLVISSTDYTMKAYRTVDGEVVEVPVEIIGE
jgi:proteasome lid subunit RPN8/RPN11